MTPPRDVLNAELHTALETFARQSPAIVATDFDGVLAPIVQDPMAARPLEGTIDSLRALAAQTDVTVAVVSGRDLDTLRQLAGLKADHNDDDVILIGSHGAQSSRPLGVGAADGELDEAAQAALTSATELIQGVITRFGDARIEHKPAGVVLHTRGMPDADADAASTAVLEGADALEGVHAMRGKSVVELSVIDTSKGAALESLAAQVGSQALLYLGDDVTDETVFSRMTGAADVSIKVGEGDTAARYRVAGPEGAAECLTVLVQGMPSRVTSS